MKAVKNHARMLVAVGYSRQPMTVMVDKKQEGKAVYEFYTTSGWRQFDDSLQKDFARNESQGITKVEYTKNFQNYVADFETLEQTNMSVANQTVRKIRKTMIG